MTKRYRHTASTLPPDVAAALADEPAAAQAEYAELWALAARADAETPDDATFRDLGRDMWAELEASIAADVQPAKPSVRPQPERAPARSAVRKARFRPARWVAFAACLALLAAVGLSLWQQPLTTTAPLGETVAVTLPDGSSVLLNSGSELTYPRSFDATRIVELTGEALFDVEKGTAPFVVETFNGATTVLGTQFNVRAWPDDPVAMTRVTVLEGLVRFASLDDTRGGVLLEAGQTARLAAAAALPTSPESVPADYAVAWQSGGFKFTDVPLATVLQELERRYAVEITVEDTALLDDSVSILIEKSLGAEQIVSDICEYNGYSFRETSDGFAIYRPVR